MPEQKKFIVSYENMKVKNTTLLLLLIIITASFLRLYNFFEIPYTHDEFSALFRTNFSSFSQLIEKGVKVDGHPAGVQVFLYYYSQLFGISEWVIKTPFIIAGILSVLLIFLIGKKWYNETVGLLAASFLATIQYTVMYSQIARPYISGLFFSLLMVYFWTNIIFNPQKRFYFNSVFFILSASACSYNHYFSLLFSAIVGISGLFFVQRKYLIKYLLSGLIVVLLFLPHLKIFFYQLHLGGIGDWLGKPHNDFILNFIEYIFQFSVFSGILTILILLSGFYKIKRAVFRFKFFILSLIWFFVPFFIGFLYSKYINSVLQYSTLIFSFPYLFFILFGHLKLQNKTINTLLVLFILTINSLVLIFERKHYDLFYHSPYEQILVEYKNKCNDNIKTISIIDSHKKISQYYISKHSIKPDFIWYDSFRNELDFRNFLSRKYGDYDSLYFGCLSSSNPVIIPVILEFFPTIAWQRNYAGGTAYLFTKNPGNLKTISVLDFESEKENWTSLNAKNINDSIKFSGKYSYLIDHTTEWSPTYRNQLDKMIYNKNNFIDLSVQVYIHGNSDSVLLVSSLEESKGNTIDWRATTFNTFIDPSEPFKKWVTIHHSIKLSDIYLNYKNIEFSAYIWNRGKHDFFIDDFTIKLRQGNPVIYGLYEKI